MIKKIIILIIMLIIIIGCICVNASNKTVDKINSKVDIEYIEYIMKINEELILTQVQDNKKNEVIYYDIPLSYEIQDYIREICDKYNVNMETILAIMKIESNFQQDIKTKNNIGGGYSIGIMQLNNNYIDWYSEITNIGQEFDINNIYHNIEGGIAVYKNYKDYWKEKGYEGNELKIRSLNSYNMGVQGFQNYVKRTGFISRNYDRKVLNYKKEELQWLEVTNIKDY